MASLNTPGALVQATMERISARLPDLACELFPDDPEEYSLLHPVGAVLVRYKGSSYGPSQDVDLVAQERGPQVELTLITRSLNGSEGATQFLERLRLIVMGWKPLGFSPCRMVRDEFISQQGGQWRHALDFSTTTLAVAAQEDCADSFGRVRQITIENGDVHGG